MKTKLPCLVLWSLVVGCAGFPSAKDALALVPQPQRVIRGVGAAGSEEILYRTDRSIPKEGYRICIGEKGAEIVSSDVAGRFYAERTLDQLPRPWPVVTIEDAPAYSWRGLHLDEARHFFGKKTVKRMLDLMAQHKFNRFHWHLTDDQGWRLAVPGYPELERYAAVRSSDQRAGFNTSDPIEAAKRENQTAAPYGPYYYTEADLREIVAYAAERHITIVPEIDLPGHVAAALAAYPEMACQPANVSGRDPRLAWGVSEDVLCVGNDRAIKFVEDVLDYVATVFPSKEVHLGGDECPTKRWKECPKCRARIAAEGLADERELESWLLSRLSRRLKAKGRRIICWNDALRHPRLLGDPIVMCWLSGSTYEEMSRIFVPGATAAGYDVVVTPYWKTYLNNAQGLEDDPVDYRDKKAVTLEACHGLDPTEGVKPENRSHILGLQACNWTEGTRGEAELFAKMWPRAAAIAEAAWCGPWKPSFEDFLGRMKEHDGRLAAWGVRCMPATPQPKITTIAFSEPIRLKGKTFEVEIRGDVPHERVTLVDEDGRKGILHIETAHAGVTNCLRQLEVEPNVATVKYPWNGREYSIKYCFEDEGQTFRVDVDGNWDFILDCRVWLEGDGKLSVTVNDGKMEEKSGIHSVTGSTYAVIRLSPTIEK